MNKATLIKKSDARIVDLGTKVIRKYTAPDKLLEVNRMTITGRHPENTDNYIFETKVHFMVYVVKLNYMTVIKLLSGLIVLGIILYSLINLFKSLFTKKHSFIAVSIIIVLILFGILMLLPNFKKLVSTFSS